MSADTETDNAIVWQAAAGILPRVHVWDGDYVVYNPLSGDTHFLDISAGEVLLAVIKQQMPARDIARHLSQFLEVPDDAAMAKSVAGLVAHLDELGLIEPAGGC